MNHFCASVYFPLKNNQIKCIHYDQFENRQRFIHNVCMKKIGKMFLPVNLAGIKQS